LRWFTKGNSNSAKKRKEREGRIGDEVAPGAP